MKVSDSFPAAIVLIFLLLGCHSNEAGCGNADILLRRLSVDRKRELAKDQLQERATYFVYTFAGTGFPGISDGPRISAGFNTLFGIGLDSSGSLFVADGLNHKIRKIDANGNVSTVAGSGNEGAANGIGSRASFYQPQALAVDKNYNIYIADYNNKIRKISPDGRVSDFAGSGVYGSADGPAAKASFKYISDMAFDGEGNLFVAEVQGHKIRKISPDGQVSTLAGTG